MFKKKQEQEQNYEITNFYNEIINNGKQLLSLNDKEKYLFFVKTHFFYLIQDYYKIHENNFIKVLLNGDKSSLSDKQKHILTYIENVISGSSTLDCTHVDVGFKFLIKSYIIKNKKTETQILFEKEYNI